MVLSKSAFAPGLKFWYARRFPAAAELPGWEWGLIVGPPWVHGIKENDN
jgi:hypothetical protein